MHTEMRKSTGLSTPIQIINMKKMCVFQIMTLTMYTFTYKVLACNFK